MVPGLLKAGIDDINNLVKPHVKALIENQLKEMQSTKVIMILWVKWKKPVKSAITIDPKDEGNPMDVKGDIADNDTVKPLYSGRFFVAPAESRSNSHGKALHCEHFYSEQLS